MNIIDEIVFVTPERKIELEKLIEKEIQDLKNNVISKEEFISYIKLKKISFCDFCYLINEYFGSISVIVEDSLPHLDIEKIDELIEVKEPTDIYYDLPRNRCIAKIQNTKRIKKYENMALKGRKIIKKKR